MQQSCNLIYVKKVRTGYFNDALFHFFSNDKGYSIIKKDNLIFLLSYPFLLVKY